ncbi:MAG: lysylphosphatidylglycerol synthase domain-containing protein [Steroidobacteraceae bacterium]
MNYRFLFVGALGVALAAYLVKFVGVGAVLSAATAVGWRGFVLLCLYAAALFPLLGTAWYTLLPEAPARYFGITVWARMVRDSAAEVLPFSQLGGIALGARAATTQGMPAPLTFASMIADITTELFAQIAYAAAGVAILATWTPPSGRTPAHTSALVAGLVLAMAGGATFVFLQLKGRRFTGKIAARLLPRAVSTTEALAAALDSIYRSRLRIALSATVHLTAWIASAGGTWIAFRLIGSHPRWPAVLALESLVYAARSAAPFVPNALGVQEAAYAALAPLLGIGAELGLAVSLIKRARDIALGIPILLIWQAVEGRRALAERAS